MRHSNRSSKKHPTTNHALPYGKSLVLAVFVAVAISTVLLVPQDAFSTLIFTGYSNSTSTSGISNSTLQTSNNTSNQSSNTTGHSTSTTNSTGNTGSTSSTQNTAGTKQTSTNQASSSGTNSTQTNTNGTGSTQSHVNETTNQSSQTTESSSPVASPPPDESGPVNSGSDGITILSPNTSSSSESSQSNESVISPSIVISGIDNSGTNDTKRSSTIYSPTVYTGAPILPSDLSLANDQSYYAYGDVVTIKTALPGLSLQNVAIVVADPTGDDIVSRTVTTDKNGTAQLQFKIPSNFETGSYKDIATALVEGKNYTNSTEFNVIKTHGISIDSVQLIDQQGNPVSMIKKGQNNFVQVSISSGEKMPALFTLNLFDTNQSSIGTASIKSTITPGDSQMTFSFFIPPNAHVGTSDIFTDAYSDWPSNGGTPLTLESCLSASLEDPATLPVSYQPVQPQTCTQHPENLTGTTLVSNAQYKMTNDQATVTLGIAVQNDSMTFMSPTQAHLLALAYQNGAASKTADKSISLVSLNLGALNSTVTNTTGSSGITNFTTLLGPALQNDPMAQKILQEIQISKKQVANIIGNETAAQINNELIQKQRVAAASQLKQDLTALQQANVASTPSAQYSQFLSTVSDNRTQQVFEGEFNFMQQRVAAANAAMQNVLDQGGSWDQAIQTFDNYAAVNHAQIVQINQNLNVAYGLADSSVQSCFDSNGDLTVVNGTNPCIANLGNNSTSPSGIKIVSVQPTDQSGNPVSLFTRGQSGFVRVQLQSSYVTPTLVTINLFDSNLDTLGTTSAKYTLNPGKSEVVLPYYVPPQATTGLASIYADTLTDWPNKGGSSESHELSYFVGLS
ncbi:MAG: hypothetical protein KGI27_08920 [Thaumarchaeota archaeon]|nr:hypothetical protein [Nitrososphaerota archaeon]